jgi:hypothetical protein
MIEPVGGLEQRRACSNFRIGAHAVGRGAETNLMLQGRRPRRLRWSANGRLTRLGRFADLRR